MTPRFTVARSLQELGVTREQWNTLVLATPCATVFQTYEWFQCWWRTFGRGRQLYVVLAWDGHDLVGIAPLMRLRRHGLRQLEIVGAPGADYLDFILGPRPGELIEPLARFLHAQRGQWDTLVLRNVPLESPTFGRLPAAMRALGLGATDGERVACPTLLVASRPGEVRELLHGYAFRRRLKGLRRHGELSFRRLTTREDVAAWLPAFFEQHLARHADGGRKPIADTPGMQAFLSALAPELLPTGWLHFSVLTCGGTAAAFHLGFEFRGRLYWYKPCFDPRLARQSPGVALLACLIRDAQELGLEELDFTVGGEPFKYRYANAERHNANIRVFAGRGPYGVALAVAWARRRASLVKHLLQRIRRRARPDANQA